MKLIETIILHGMITWENAYNLMFSDKKVYKTLLIVQFQIQIMHIYEKLYKSANSYSVISGGQIS